MNMNATFTPFADIKVGDRTAAGTVVEIVNKKTRKTIDLICEYESPDGVARMTQTQSRYSRAAVFTVEPTEYTLDPTPAGSLNKHDRVLHADRGVFTLSDRPLRLRGRGVDQQWVTLRFTNGEEIEVHEGDYFDRITDEG